MTTEMQMDWFEKATPDTEIVTTWHVVDGPIVDGNSGERVQITTVTRTVYEDGTTDVSVMGRSMTKNGQPKSTHAYFHAGEEASDAVRAALGIETTAAKYDRIYGTAR